MSVSLMKGHLGQDRLDRHPAWKDAPLLLFWCVPRNEIRIQHLPTRMEVGVSLSELKTRLGYDLPKAPTVLAEMVAEKLYIMKASRGIGDAKPRVVEGTTNEPVVVADVGVRRELLRLAPPSVSATNAQVG